MNLTIDIGNTNQTYSYFNNKELTIGSLAQLSTDISMAKKILVSSVNDDYLNLIPSPYISIKTLINNNQLLDMPINYTSTLGQDRSVLAYYLYKKYPGTSVIIDSGTFTTLDIVTKDGYQGGYILPGLEVLKQTYQAGTNLRSTSLDPIKKESIPTSTSAAMSAGLMATFLYPLESIIQKIEAPRIFMTGGSATIIHNHFEQRPHIHYEKNLMHMALQFIATEVF
ncbi:MAG: type III pantothenate kinase [Halobacteriovoraceae bacterium]|jgi:pantothenate kinase type III|nr:type III pantothenate kinase [Halobacteriovoraceae bacterium]